MRYLTSSALQVRGWDAKLSWTKPVLEFDLAAEAPGGTEKMVGVRSLDYDHRRGMLLAGTSCNEVSPQMR